MNNYSIFDVANWFLSMSSMTPKKLQKLAYYAQAWSYALYNRPMFTGNGSEFEAWAHGPVSQALYNRYKEYGWNPISKIDDDSTINDQETLDLLQSVWMTYGDKTANELEALTHQEDPWKIARRGLSEGERSHNIISPADMRRYYRSIYNGD